MTYGFLVLPKKVKSLCDFFFVLREATIDFLVLKILVCCLRSVAILFVSLGIERTVSVHRNVCHYRNTLTELAIVNKFLTELD